jgi:hypothetical protein
MSSMPVAPDTLAAPAPTGRQPSRITQRSRDEIADRLLASSAEHSFDPLTAIDWESAFDPNTFFMNPRRVTLYGTPLWDTMSLEQQVELSKHEVASMMHIGIWFETILMALLTRHIYDLDPRSKHVHYAWTEIADECRHSTMFGMALEKFGTPDYSPSPRLMRQGKLMLSLPSGPATWAAILLGEELIDTAQREAMHDPAIQPIMRDITRIHVIEEARHVRYAREELARQMSELTGAARERERLRTAITASVIAGNFVTPRVYAGVGLDADAAARAVKHNPHRRETLSWMADKLVAFLRQVGLIGGPTELIWHKAGLL